MRNPVNLHGLTPTAQMTAENESELAELQEMLRRAETYLKSFEWCPTIQEKYLAIGIGGVLALFLFRFEHPVCDSDEWLWVVVGDLPPAYFVVDDARTAQAALTVYCELMDQWADAAAGKSSLEGVFPVQAPATPESAKMLRKRLRFIRDNIIPM